jgi:GNAT superfamily N-acetyltransferase
VNGELIRTYVDGLAGTTRRHQDVGMVHPVSAGELRIVPANQATCHDLEMIFGTADYPCYCQCQRFKVTGWLWRDTTLEERLAMQHASTGCGKPAAQHTSGLVAYLEDEPVGWVAVEPRIAYPKLRSLRVPWTGRSEDKDDDGIWAVTCFCVRKGYRGRGITYPLAQASAGYAREQGATAVEGYAMVTEPGLEITWGELHVGAVQVFDEAGFTEVSAPTKRRRVMRIDF